MSTALFSYLWCWSRLAKSTISSHMDGAVCAFWKVSPGPICCGRGGQSLPAHRFHSKAGMRCLLSWTHILLSRGLGIRHFNGCVKIKKAITKAFWSLGLWALEWSTDKLRFPTPIGVGWAWWLMKFRILNLSDEKTISFRSYVQRAVSGLTR